MQAFFREERRKGRSYADLYELVQHAGNVLPRLYVHTKPVLMSPCSQIGIMPDRSYCKHCIMSMPSHHKVVVSCALCILLALLSTDQER